jgi:uncharacterized protein (TIGR02453 family)
MNTALFQFLRELGENNNREWFQGNKTRYDGLLKQYTGRLQLLVDRIAAFDPELAGLEAKSCLFRIYRDMRFSPDKTPYKTFLGAYIAVGGGRSSPYAGYYVHLEPGHAFLSGGIWCPPPPLLRKLRQDIYDNMEEFLAIVDDPDFKATYPALEGDVLKRMPAGFPADAPHGDILRHKDFVVSAARPDGFFCTDDWIDRAAEVFRRLLPFNRFLNYTASEFYGRIQP